MKKLFILSFILTSVLLSGSRDYHEHQIPPCVCMPNAPSGWWDGRCWDYGWERIAEREKEGIPSYEKVCKP